MTKMFRTSLAVLTLSLAAPLASFAQTCPDGYTYTPIAGGGYSCLPIASAAPEIGASASIGGVALLLCGVMMLRGRKRAASAIAL